MNNKMNLLVPDIGMVILLPLLMAYSLIGEQFHEIVGTVMLILLILHLVQHRRWFGAIPKGRYTARRVFQTVLDILLLVPMVLQPVSGILMSKHLYTFIQIPGIASFMRQIHMVLGYWGFILASLHAGTHLQSIFRNLWKKNSAVKTGTILFAAVGCLYGAYAFFKRQLASYLFLKTMFVFFDFSESRALFILDYLAIMVLFACLGLSINLRLTDIKEKKRIS